MKLDERTRKRKEKTCFDKNIRFIFDPFTIFIYDIYELIHYFQTIIHLISIKTLKQSNDIN